MKISQKLSDVLVLSQEKPLSSIFWVSTFSFLTAIAAQIEIPVQPVPFTLQTFFVLLSGAVLGSRRGAYSMGMYLMLGIIGLPVFAGGSFGIAKILGPTGGYLLSFPLAALLVGYLTKTSRGYIAILASMFAGSLVVFGLGTLQLQFMYFHNWTNALHAGFFIFSLWDIVKVTAAATIVYYYHRSIHHVS